MGSLGFHSTFNYYFLVPWLTMVLGESGRSHFSDPRLMGRCLFWHRKVLKYKRYTSLQIVPSQLPRLSHLFSPFFSSMVFWDTEDTFSVFIVFNVIYIVGMGPPKAATCMWAGGRKRPSTEGIPWVWVVHHNLATASSILFILDRVQQLRRLQFTMTRFGTIKEERKWGARYLTPIVSKSC